MPYLSFSKCADNSNLLLSALRRFRETDEAKDVTFTVKYFPFQLYPEATQEGEDKYEWCKLYNLDLLQLLFSETCKMGQLCG